MRRLELSIVVLCVVYVIAIVTLYVRGEGIVAAYLTMPAWYLLGALALAMYYIGPDSITQMLGSWGGNLLLLFISASLNAAAAYVVGRTFVRGRSI